MRFALDELGLEYQQELIIGRYSADFALVDQKIDIEADGEYWHDPIKDAHRDRILARYGWRTIRLRGDLIEKSTNLSELIKIRLEEG